MRLLKFLGISLVSLMIASSGWCAWQPSKPADNEKLKDTPALIRANWDAIALGTDASLQITNAKVSASAGIVDTKLANITTAGKVSATAITGLASMPSGAGALPIANGGTGQTTRQASLDALLGTQTGLGGKALITDGTNASFGYPSDLTISSATTGDVLYYNGTTWTRLASGTTDYALVSNGTGTTPAYEKISLTAGVQGTLPVANGGTGTTSLTDIGLPSQGGNSGKYLTTNGSASSWGTLSADGKSNVVFGWYGISDYQTNLTGLYVGTSARSTSGMSYAYIISKSDNFYTILRGKFTKTAGINTLTLFANLDGDGDGRQVYVKANVGGIEGTCNRAGTSMPGFGWSSGATLDVSSLSNGTTYDITISMRNTGSTYFGFCAGVVLIDS